MFDARTLIKQPCDYLKDGRIVCVERKEGTNQHKLKVWPELSQL